MPETAPPPTAPPVAPYDCEVFYDGDCPLCRKEINMIRWMDKKSRIRFTDIAAEGFATADYGKTMDELMAEIHGRDENGDWLIGVEVFRRLYAAVGFGPLVAVTRLPGVRHALDLGYTVFAKQRLRLTGRCREGACEVPKSSMAKTDAAKSGATG